MPKLSRADVAQLLAAKMADDKIKHRPFMQLAKLYVQLVSPPQRYARKKAVRVADIQHETKRITKEMRPPATAPTVDEIIRKIEQDKREQK